MYTIQFGSRAHFLEDGAAARVLSAIERGESFVTVPIDLAGDAGDHYEVTLNVAHIIAVIKHRDQDKGEAPVQPPRLALVQ